MKEIKIQNLLKTNYLVTRDMADRLKEYYSPYSTFDFSEINFISAAFADEFQRMFLSSRVINAKLNVRKMLTTVSKRENQG
jgi:hypothetical protein